MTESQKEENRKVVPWFSMSEWEDVYQQVYSNDVTAQQKGYEKILVWKARCPKLPAGIECTLNLIQVSLQDQQIWSQIVDGLLPPYKEYDLRLMYSTAIMRFLNQISMVAQDQFESMYKMAKKIHIPDWVVNVRHEFAHGHNLPSLNVLRSATHFALDWIHEHYWKGELILAADYFSMEVHTDKRAKVEFREYIELWQALYLYYLHDYAKVVDIPDKEFLSRLSKVLVRLMPKRKIQQRAEMLEMSQVFKDRSVKEVLSQLVHHTKMFVKIKKQLLPKDEIVSILLESETFIASEALINGLGAENDDTEPELLHPIIRKIWQDIMPLLTEADIYPLLMERLIQLINKKEETTYRRTAASKWLNEICLSLIKATWVTKTFKQVEYDKSHNMNSNLIDEVKDEPNVQDTPNVQTKDLQIFRKPKRLLREIESIYPEKRSIMTINRCEIPNSADLLKLILMSPNQWTLTFLSSFLELIEPEISPKMKKNIIELIQIYMCTTAESTCNNDRQPADDMYNLDMLLNNIGTYDYVDSDEMEVDNESTKLQRSDKSGSSRMQNSGNSCSTEQQSVTWTKSEAYHEWKMCPLGILPWQKKTNNNANVSLVCESVWKSTTPANGSGPIPWLSSHVHETVDWNNIQPVRKRIKRLKKRPNVLKKAG